MISADIPGFGKLTVRHLVLDYNGTIAYDGSPVPGIPEIIEELSRHVTVHVLTADTFGTVAAAMQGVPCTVTVIGRENQAEAKRAYVGSLGPNHTAAVGNGRNDGPMLKEAALGIAVVQGEGAAVSAVVSADIVCTDIIQALSLLTHPVRLTATLRD